MINNFYQEATDGVVNSGVVAKAIIKNRFGFEALVVFKGSSRSQFFWVMKIERPNSPIETSKVFSKFERAGRKYSDFRSFIENYLATRDGYELISIEFDPIRLDSLQKAQDLPVDIYQIDDPDMVNQTRLVNKKFQRKAYGRKYGFGW